MLYSNTLIESKKVEMEFGELSQITLGEKGRGRKEIRLACPDGCVVAEGLNANLTIGMTKSGRPRVNVQKDGTLYLLLSTKGGYTRRGGGRGFWWIGNTAKYELLAHGYGADGDAGRIGQWGCYLVKVSGTPENDWVCLKIGGGRGYQWIHIGRTGVFLFDDTEKAMDFADAMGLDFPNVYEYEWGWAKTEKYHIDDGEFPSEKSYWRGLWEPEWVKQIWESESNKNNENETGL
jgi:hypothetical protein